MRWRIIRALFVKEVRRHVANRGGLVLCGLLVIAAILMRAFNPVQVEAGAAGGELVGGVHHCYVQYSRETPLIAELRQRVPANLHAQLLFDRLEPHEVDAPMILSPGTGAIRLIESAGQLTVDLWHPPGDPGALAVYERWMLRSLYEIQRGSAAAPLRDDDLWAAAESFRQLRRDSAQLPELLIFRNGLGAKPLDYRTAVSTAMVVFALYLLCCYLLPTLNCEERERGVLLAQALSPASPLEIVAAKFLFYPTIGIGLAAVLAGITNPNVLGTLFFWLALLAMSGGFLGIGMTVSTLARTQRSAFMGSMCYLLVIALFLFVCNQSRIPYLPLFAIETHGPKILHAAITMQVVADDWWRLLATFALAACWMTLAAHLFRTRGWQ